MSRAKASPRVKKGAPKSGKPAPGSRFWSPTPDQLAAWLDGLAGRFCLLAPRQLGGVTRYARVQAGAGAGIDPARARPLIPVKEVLLPPSERLFAIHRGAGQVRLEESYPEWETVVFGVRPCEARGVRALDAAFLETGAPDAAYARRRGNTTLVGLACREPGPSCFCTSVGGAPDDPQGMDLMLYEMESGCLVEAVTDKGRFLVPDGEWPQAAAGREPARTQAAFRAPHKEDWPGHFKDEYWARIGERCLSCRACAYVCPTCRCFAVRDEVLAPGEYERLRCWDSCMGENYRRVAGGHRPREKKGERQRNRFFCKFYYFPEQYGLGAASACTGCGRCIEVCPVGVDVTEILIDLEAQS